MLTRTALLATLLSASAVVATSPQGHLQMKRALEARQTRGSGNNDDDNDNDSINASATACLGAVFSLLASVPTPPPALVSAFTSAGIDDIGDACTYTPPPNLAAPYSSYASAVSSWYGANGDRVSSALKDCPGSGDALDRLDEPCGATSRGSGPTRSVGGGDSSSSSSSSRSFTVSIGGGDDDDDSSTTRSVGGGSSDAAQTTGAATTGGPSVQTTGLDAGAVSTTSSRTAGVGPQQTGFAGAALVAAGFLGVVAAL